jgi:anti-sigma-K factor RskA
VPDGLWSQIALRLPERQDEAEAPPMPRLTPEVSSPFRAPAKAPERRRRAMVATIGAIAVGAAAVAAVLGIGLVRADNKVTNLQSAQSATSSAVAAALGAPGHRVVTLDSSTHDGQAKAVVLPSGQGYLISSTLPPLDKGRTYQLWAIEGNQPVSLGLLGGSPGQAAFTMAGSTHPSHLSITAEPAGGSVFPTGPIIATGTV